MSAPESALVPGSELVSALALVSVPVWASELEPGLVSVLELALASAPEWELASESVQVSGSALEPA